jgi:Protein of unknown function (DUF2917)
MTTTAMLPANDAADLAWALAPGTAATLMAQQPQWLWVHEGRVWLTRGNGEHEGDDVWLEPGERHLLPAGTRWVAEGWPSARVSLVVMPSLVSSRVPSFGASARVWPHVPPVRPAAPAVPRAA